MRNIFKRGHELADCEWKSSCDCSSPSATKDKSCEKCRWYWWVDFGCGFCRALPEHIIVAWCRDVCSLFTYKQTNNSNVAQGGKDG